MVRDSESFLVHCYYPKTTTIINCNELRYEKYHSKAFKFDLEKLSPTSSSIQKHIQRTYFQEYVWSNSPTSSLISLDPLDYEYKLSKNNSLIPDTVVVELPEDFPLPCTCLKCSRENVCPCRVKQVYCCQY